MLERLCSWHKNPINAFLHIVSFVVWTYGAWMQDWQWMVGAVVICLIGHIIQMSTEKSAKVVPVVAKKKRR